jgi:hypothetical protein
MGIAMGEDPQSLVIDLSDQTRLHFNSPNDLNNWLSKEQQAFQWFTEGGSRAGGGTQGLAEVYMRNFANIRQSFNSWSSAPNDERYKVQLANQIQGFYGNATVVRSDHAYARIANEINAKDGAIAASAAFAFLLGVDCQLTFQTFKGLLSARLLRDGIAPESSDLVAKALIDLDSAAKSQMASQSTEWSKLTAECSTQLQSTDAAFKGQSADFASATTQTFERVDESVKKSLESIQKTEATYKAQMQLQAPVEYWQSKAEKHAAALRRSRWTLIGFTALGSVILVGMLFYLTSVASSVAQKSTAETTILLKYAAIGVVMTTIAFWIGKVLLKIYLSDRHLLTDAEERIALIKTFLALSNDAKVEATDRALILAPLFRSAADGIVKEDGPDTSVATLLAKVLDGRAGR